MEYKDFYIFPAIFDYADEGINITFPDLPGAITCGENEEDGLYMAKDCLELHLFGIEQDNEPIPEPSKVRDIKTEKNEAVVMIKVFMKPVRDEMRNRAIKKTLTIPQWLNDMAKKQKINFSAVLKTALMDELEIER